MAVRKQRRAHTFLATWRLRTTGSIMVFITITALACFPIYAQVTGATLTVLDGNMFGLRYFPEKLPCISSLKAMGCLGWTGFIKPSCPVGGSGVTFTEDIANSAYDEAVVSSSLSPAICGGKFFEEYM